MEGIAPCRLLWRTIHSPCAGGRANGRRSSRLASAAVLCRLRAVLAGVVVPRLDGCVGRLDRPPPRRQAAMLAFARPRPEPRSAPAGVTSGLPSLRIADVAPARRRLHHPRPAQNRSLKTRLPCSESRTQGSRPEGFPAVPSDEPSTGTSRRASGVYPKSNPPGHVLGVDYTATVELTSGRGRARTAWGPSRASSTSLHLGHRNGSKAQRPTLGVPYSRLAVCLSVRPAAAASLLTRPASGRGPWFLVLQDDVSP
jgi:hypothetical protein